MWRGFGAEADEPPAQRGYFRPRISSISGVLAMTKQRLFTSGVIKDEMQEHVAHTASIHPIVSGPSTGGAPSHHLLTDSYLVNGLLQRCPSPARSSYGDVMSFSRSASARPSIDSQTAHAIYGIYGDPLGIHDPSEAELGGVGTETNGTFAKRSRKVFRGIILMIMITMCYVSAIHLFRMSFHRERILMTISPMPNNFNLTKSRTLPMGTTPESITNSPTTEQSTRSPPSLPVPPYSLPSTRPPYTSRRRESRVPKEPELPKSNFDAPYFVTWYVTLWNILYLPVYLMVHTCCLSRRSKSAAESVVSGSVDGSTVSNNAFGSNISNKSGSRENGPEEEDNVPSIKKVFGESVQGLMEKGFTPMQFFYRCAFFCSLCALANYMFIFSLRILDATVVMALLSCSVSIIYLLSWVVLHQQFVGIRIVGIIVVDTGIALLVYMDGVQHRTLAVVMIAFGSAIVFGVYRVVMRRMIGYTTFAQMALFHTLVGLLNLFLAWPLVLLLYVTGVETIVWSAIPWSYLTAAAACTFLANVITSFGVICTYEVFLTLGLFFPIPISAVIDIYINSVIFRDMKLGGILLILIGFIVVLLPDNWNLYLTNVFRKRLANWKRREALKKSGRVQDTTTGQLSRLRTSSGRVK